MTCFESSEASRWNINESQFPDLISAVERSDSADQLLQTTRDLSRALAIHCQDPTEGPPPSEALSCLVRILGYNNPGAAVAAVDGLISGGSNAVAVLLGGLDENNYGARAWAVRALAGIGDVRGLDLLEQALADDIGPSVRRAAAIGMGTLKVGHLDPPRRSAVQKRALEALEKASADSEWVVRYAVAAALEKLSFGLNPLEPSRDAAFLILDTLADIDREEVPVVRLRASLALKRLASP
jgi:phycocyanobilin lyase beta subunit